MAQGYPCKHFSIGLPHDGEDQSLTALFRHVADYLAEDDPIDIDDVRAIGFETELDADAVHRDADAVYRGTFTIVLADQDLKTAQT